MTTLSEMESKASGLLCPDCGTCSLTIHLRCDMQDQECLTVATCRHCNRQFDAESVPTYQERYEISRDAANAPCPSCGTPQRVLRWSCSRTARTCHLLLICEGCGVEQAA
jgi:hypothetical protein